MKDGHANDAANEAKVEQVVRVDARVGVDLQRVVVVCRVRKETIDRIEHVVGEQEEPLTTPNPTSHTCVSGPLQRPCPIHAVVARGPCHAAIVQAVLALKLDKQAAAQILGAVPRHLLERALKHLPARYLDRRVCPLVRPDRTSAP